MTSAREATREQQAVPASPAPDSGDLTPHLIDTDQWTDAMVASAGIPVIDCPMVMIGGGIGSFVMADYLRIAGVPTHDLRILTTLDFPWQTYQFLTRVSQILESDRLRSDSASRPDNIWAFPSYAWSEAFSARTVREFVAPLWRVLVEPIFADYYSPKSGHVFRALARESARIRYQDMVVKSQVRMVRRRLEGGYFSVVTPPPGTSSTKRVAYRSKYVHIAVGYPGLRFLPDLQSYREQHRDYTRVVNAYEPHDHVYENLLHRAGTVIVRGGGVVASRVLQRLMDDRDNTGVDTRIVHIFRTFVSSSHGPSIFMRRRGSNGWAYQGFNYPKSAWGGQLKHRMRKLEGEDRVALYETIGGTNTPKRKGWQNQMAQGRREGWYRTYAGEVEQIVRGDDGSILTRIKTADGVLEIPAAYIIDATGMEADIGEHRLLADLLKHGGAGRNPLGRLDVDRNFELRGAGSGDGLVYASGAATLGGYFPGVDTFLGLQIAAQEICDDLAARGFCRRIGITRSTSQWLKWVRNKAI